MMDNTERIALLRRIATRLAEDGEQMGYGHFPGGDPREFTPDKEGTTDAEREAHRLACEAWDRGERVGSEPAHRNGPGPSGEPVESGMVGPGGAVLWRHVTMYGLGSYTWRDTDTLADAAALEALAAELAATPPARTAAQTAAVERCTEEKRAAWGACDHLARFEAWADLYHTRFRRLSPGKDDPFRDSGDEENLALCDAWHSTGLAAHDAIMRVVALEQAAERLSRELEDARESASDLAAAPPAPPWLPAPDGPGEWWVGRPGAEAEPINVIKDGGRLWAYEIGMDEGSMCPVEDWSICRWSRRTPVIVPAAEEQTT